VTRAATTTDADSPPYQVAAREDLYELRIYGGHYVARAPYNNREKGLAALMSYIEGGNEETKTFPATQPLIMRYTCAPGTEDVAGKTMELSLGAGVTDPPASVDPTNVGVAAAGGELVAVVGFEGVATPGLLTTAIESDGLSLAEPDGFRLATYGQLYSLKPRLNELMIKVKPPGA
jgi:pre-mRNA-processing factor 19